MSNPAADFRLPKYAATYTRSIFDRSRDLIAHNVWSGFQQDRLDAWIKNFQTGEEQYLGAKILDALIYRSKDQTIALIQQLFQRKIPDLQRLKHISPSLSNVYTSLRKKADPGVRVVPVLPLGGGPIKSGALVGRYLRRNLGCKDDWIVDSSQVESLLSENKTIIFLDDFLGTGTQFIEFVEGTGLRTAVMSGQCIYVPLAGHKEGLRRLEERFPDLGLATVERLDETHALFHEDAGNFPDEENSVETARSFYHQLLKDRKIKANEKGRRGFGYFELVYAFEDAVPDNSLPILWWADSPDWQPLFSR